MSKSRDAFRTISEVADVLDTPAHVLRFWESKFTQVKPVKRAGGRRYYRPSDVDLLSGIRKLLHDDGMTIKGVQKVLREQGVKHVTAIGADPTGKTASDITIDEAPFIEAPYDETGPETTLVSFPTSTKSAKRLPDPEPDFDAPFLSARPPNEPEADTDSAPPLSEPETPASDPPPIVAEPTDTGLSVSEIGEDEPADPPVADREDHASSSDATEDDDRLEMRDKTAPDPADTDAQGSAPNDEQGQLWDSDKAADAAEAPPTDQPGSEDSDPAPPHDLSQVDGAPEPEMAEQEPPAKQSSPIIEPMWTVSRDDAASAQGPDDPAESPAAETTHDLSNTPVSPAPEVPTHAPSEQENLQDQSEEQGVTEIDMPDFASEAAATQSENQASDDPDAGDSENDAQAESERETPPETVAADKAGDAMVDHLTEEPNKTQDAAQSDADTNAGEADGPALPVGPDDAAPEADSPESPASDPIEQTDPDLAETERESAHADTDTRADDPVDRDDSPLVADTTEDAAANAPDTEPAGPADEDDVPQTTDSEDSAAPDEVVQDPIEPAMTPAPDTEEMADTALSFDTEAPENTPSEPDPETAPNPELDPVLPEPVSDDAGFAAPPPAAAIEIPRPEVFTALSRIDRLDPGHARAIASLHAALGALAERMSAPPAGPN